MIRKTLSLMLSSAVESRVERLDIQFPFIFIVARCLRVICRQLGLSGGRMSCCASGGSGTIWMSSLDCYGDEYAIATCYHRDGMGLNTCQHSDDVYVECDGHLTTVNPPPPAPSSPTTSSSVVTQPTGEVLCLLLGNLTLPKWVKLRKNL